MLSKSQHTKRSTTMRREEGEVREEGGGGKQVSQQIVHLINVNILGIIYVCIHNYCTNLFYTITKRLVADEISGKTRYVLAGKIQY